MSDLTLFQVIATEFRTAFTKDNPRQVYTLKDGSPQWMTNAIYAAHKAVDDRMPDDWIYEACCACVDEMTELKTVDDDSASDASYEIADRQTETNTHALLQWLASNIRNADLVDEANEAFGTFESYAESKQLVRSRRVEAPTIVHMIQLGQLHALQSICESLMSAIRTQVTAREPEYYAAHDCPQCDPIDHCPHGESEPGVIDPDAGPDEVFRILTENGDL
jgi:hypothetical protein